MLRRLWVLKQWRNMCKSSRQHWMYHSWCFFNRSISNCSSRNVAGYEPSNTDWFCSKRNVPSNTLQEGSKVLQTCLVWRQWRTAVSIVLLKCKKCMLHLWWRTEAKLAKVFTVFLVQALYWPLLSLTFSISLFYAHCFWPASGILRKLNFSFPSYFVITRRNV